MRAKGGWLAIIVDVIEMLMQLPGRSTSNRAPPSAMVVTGGMIKPQA